MKNEIDQTVERIARLDPRDSSLEHWKFDGEAEADGQHTKEYFGEFCTPEQIPALQALATAYTQLKADLATAKQGLEDVKTTLYGHGCGPDKGLCACCRADDIAQQTLAAIGKE